MSSSNQNNHIQLLRKDHHHQINMCGVAIRTEILTLVHINEICK
jgi:hypothetical protein